MKYCAKNIVFCILLSFLLIFSASAATLSEMEENGEVSDGGISYGDARDGVISDVSDRNENPLPDIDIGGSQRGGSRMGGSQRGGSDSLMGRTGSGDTAGDSQNSSGAQQGAAQNTGDTASEGGMSMGIIIAILVVVAVIVLIFIFLPKRK